MSQQDPFEASDLPLVDTGDRVVSASDTAGSCDVIVQLAVSA